MKYKERRFARPKLWQAALALFALIVLVGSVRGCVNERSARIDMERQLISINDSTEARLTSGSSGRRELRSLKAAARQIEGRLVAGVRVKVESDTLHAPEQAAPTQVEADGTRRAVLEDTSAG